MAESTTLEVLTSDDLRALLQERSEPALSIYLPTERAVAKAEQNVLRLKNLLSQAEERLEQKQYKQGTIAALLKPIRNLLSDPDFWSRRLDGVAILRTDSVFRHYHLPFTVDQIVVVGDRLHVRPLLPTLTACERFYILALSKNSLRLLEATRFGAEEVDVSELDIPTSLAEAMRYDDFQKTDLHTHPAAPARGGRGGKMFHGHGPGSEDVKNEIARYFRAVDAGVSKLLAEDDNPPVVLAGVDYLHALYRQSSRYRNIVPEGIVGNPEQLTVAQLHERALPPVKPHLRAGLEAAGDKYRRLEGSGLASCELEDVLRAAHEGRVEALFLRKGVEVWGRFDPVEGKIELTDGASPADELLDLAAARTLEHRGNVHLVPDKYMPCSEPLAAIYRF